MRAGCARRGGLATRGRPEFARSHPISSSSRAPGFVPRASAAGDQKRVMTPAEAARRRRGSARGRPAAARRHGSRRRRAPRSPRSSRERRVARRLRCGPGTRGDLAPPEEDREGDLGRSGARRSRHAGSGLGDRRGGEGRDRRRRHDPDRGPQARRARSCGRGRPAPGRGRVARPVRLRGARGSRHRRWTRAAGRARRRRGSAQPRGGAILRSAYTPRRRRRRSHPRAPRRAGHRDRLEDPRPARASWCRSRRVWKPRARARAAAHEGSGSGAWRCTPPKAHRCTSRSSRSTARCRSSIVLGAEGGGVRPLVAKNCDFPRDHPECSARPWARSTSRWPPPWRSTRSIASAARRVVKRALVLLAALAAAVAAPSTSPSRPRSVPVAGCRPSCPASPASTSIPAPRSRGRRIRPPPASTTRCGRSSIARTPRSRAATWLRDAEHGAIVLLYNCPTECPDIVAALTGVAQQMAIDHGYARC